MVKAMYQQFVDGMQAKVIEYGFVNGDYTKNHRYYKYVDINNANVMLVYVNTPLAFTPQQFPNLVATDVVEITAIEFKEVKQRKRRTKDDRNCNKNT
jgi:hypothetical protein